VRTFFIFAQPRSRTAWFANFLTYGESYCFHEVLRNVTDLSEVSRQRFGRRLERMVGAAGPDIPLFADELHAMFPRSKFIVIDRADDECRASLARLGVENDRSLELTRTAIEHIKAAYNPLVIRHSEPLLGQCRKICQYLGVRLDFGRFKLLDNLQVEIRHDEEYKKAALRYLELLRKTKPDLLGGA
jgi:hypothetical protein